MAKKDECKIYWLFSQNLENVGSMKDTVQPLSQLVPSTLGIIISTTSNELMGTRLLFLEIIPIGHNIISTSQTMSFGFTYRMFID